MAWYYGTYSCGHEGRTNIVGPSKDRQKKADWHFSGLCPECYKKHLEEERAAANKEAAEKSAEMELPELEGSEKQVAWANTLRMNFVEEFNKIIEGMEKQTDDMVKKNIRTILEAVENGLKIQTSSKFWIDSRNERTEVIVRSFVKELQKNQDEQSLEEVKKEIQEEMEQVTVVPETAERKPGISVIEFNAVKSILTAKYEKDDDFIKIVKSLGFKWNGSIWWKELTEYTGSQEERAAELGNKLLLAGFTVQFPNMASKEKAVSADFAPENDRWIKYSSKTGKFFITWKGTNNTLYSAAKKLPSAKWTSGSMDVNIEFYKEVEDFAETMGFLISQKAQSEIEKYKKKENEFEVAKISEHVEEVIQDEERLEKSLKSSGTILEDLKDD